MNLIGKIKTNYILRSSFGLLVVTLLIKILGYAEKLILAYYYGTSYKVDVYIIVISIILSLFYFFREIIEPGFLNVFVSAKNKGDEQGAWNLFNTGIGLILLITLIITFFTILFPDKVINIMAPGFNGNRLSLSIKLIQIAIPACIFLAISTLTSITLNSQKIFVLPASGELVFKGMIIICIIIFYKDFGIVGAAIGIFIGSIGRLLMHLIKLYDKINLRPVKNNPTYIKDVWKLTWPLLIGVSFSQIGSLMDNVFGSYLQEGAISALSYAKKIVELPVVIFPYILSIVVFPYFTQLSIEKQIDKLRTLLADSLKWIVIAFLPIASFFIIYSVPIVEIIFQRGAFNSESTLLTSTPLMIYSLGLVFFAIETILVIFYYSNADTKTPVSVGIVCVILHIMLSWVFIQWIGYIGIALAYVIQKVVKNLILLYLLRQKVCFNNRGIFIFLIKSLFSSLIFIVLLALSKALLFDKFNQSVYWEIAFMLLNIAVIGMLYLLSLKLLGIIQIKKILSA